jgi:UDP-glucose 4-epimerase
MTVLVTGGAGYIGSHMVLELLDAGERVIVLDSLSTGLQRAVPEGVPLIVGDTAWRPGDLTQIVAETQLIRQTLWCRPRFDDLATIVSHALAWERTLVRQAQRSTD